ncbi:MAG: hypothetical protein SFV23_16905 [Planctomycetaceae bacterium]|nr:hypothetical protein [Planctomycetaceae bacterium]
MTDNSVLQRFQRAVGTPAAADTAAEAVEDYGAFGWLRGIRDRAIFLELRKKDGNIRAVGYAWLQELDFDPSIGITLHLPTGKIRILGRNLNAENRLNIRLFQGITCQRVPFLQEADEVALMQAPETQTVVERIEW